MTPPDQAAAPAHIDVIDIPPEFAPTAVHPMRVRARPLAAGVRVPHPTHAWAQMAYASRGVLRVATADTTWVMPPSRAIWVPPHVTHEVVVVEDAYLRKLYVDESVVPDGLDACRVVEVSGLLLRELIVALDARELRGSFSQWRQQALLARAIPLLNQRRPLSHIARELGYQSRVRFPRCSGAHSAKVRARSCCAVRNRRPAKRQPRTAGCMTTRPVTQPDARSVSRARGGLAPTARATACQTGRTMRRIAPSCASRGPEMR